MDRNSESESARSRRLRRRFSETAVEGNRPPNSQPREEEEDDRVNNDSLERNMNILEMLNNIH